MVVTTVLRNAILQRLFFLYVQGRTSHKNALGVGTLFSLSLLLALTSRWIHSFYSTFTYFNFRVLFFFFFFRSFKVSIYVIYNENISHKFVISVFTSITCLLPPFFGKYPFWFSFTAHFKVFFFFFQ